MNVELYIADKQVDLDETSLVQLNYTAEDLNNPTIVKNSFSRQVTLKGTPANNKVFGALFELARTTTITDSVDSQSGTYFNPMVKTPFVLYRNSEVIEQGYIRMDGIERKGGAVAYKVTLFGGLGEFFYNLSYKGDGDKMSLADMAYLSGGDDELDFEINTSSVNTAWSNLGVAKPTGFWSVLNFAPAYNGVPSNFTADKGVFQPAISGFPSQVTVGDKTYNADAGWAIVDLGKEFNEWQVKDLRSYLQRPVISMRKIIEACCNPVNNGGVTVNLDEAFFNENNPYYTKTWLTLPQMQGMSLTETTATISIDFPEDDATLTPGESTPYQAITSSTYRNGKVKGTISIEPRVQFVSYDGLANYATLDMGKKIIRYTLKLLNGNTTVKSYVKNISGGNDAIYTNGDWIYYANSGYVKFERDLEFAFEAENITDIQIEVQFIQTSLSDWASGFTLTSGGSTYQIDSCYFFTSLTRSKMTYTSSSMVRSGQTITKKMLLSTEHTPAEYLISYAKMFGLQFVYNKHTKEVDITTRNTLYNGAAIDLTYRIDHSQPMKIFPFVFDSKWYDLSVEYSDANYAKYYKTSYGRVFGNQRINTGYEFNRQVKNLLDGLTFKGAVEALGRDKYFINVASADGRPIPGAFIDGGMSYKLHSSDGEEYEVNVGVKTTDTISYFNALMTYDAVPKVEFMDDKGGAVEQRDVLLFYRGKTTNSAYAKFMLTDDNGAMATLNEGQPCWILNGSSFVSSLPVFGRYLYDDAGTVAFGSEIKHSLDFGTPVELDIPNVTVADGSTIYDKAWMAYIADRYDLDTKVVTCKVNLSGIRVDAALLRNFYYFGQSWWVMNAIKNYDATKDNPIVECEFVKVKNKDNYTKGQLWQ